MGNFYYRDVDGSNLQNPFCCPILELPVNV